MTCPTLSSISGTSGTVTQTLASSCISSILNSLSSSQQQQSSTQHIQATITAISTFENGTVIDGYSNGSQVCVHLCANSTTTTTSS
jgi:hypothetical protein